VTSWHNQLGLGALEMGTPIPNDPVGAINAIAFSPVSDDRIKLQTRRERSPIQRLIKGCRGRREPWQWHPNTGCRCSLTRYEQ